MSSYDLSTELAWQLEKLGYLRGLHATAQQNRRADGLPGSPLAPDVPGYLLDEDFGQSTLNIAHSRLAELRDHYD